MIDTKSLREILFTPRGRASLMKSTLRRSNTISGQPKTSVDRSPPAQRKSATVGSVPFSTVIQHSLGRKLFEQHLRETYAQENILFYQACEHLRSMESDKKCSQQECHQLALQIFNNFIKSDAEYEINIDGELREQLLKRIQQSQDKPSGSVDCHMYDDAERHIFSLMEKDCYTRFRLTDKYTTFVDELTRHLS